MKKHFVLYLDILGFSKMMDTPDRALEIMKIIDSLNVHRHDAFKAIFFSDTLLVYNDFEIRKEEDAKYAVMFLCEFAKDLLFRTIGNGFFFRAIVTYGEFHHERMSNIDAFFGPATRDAHDAEEHLLGVGLFMNDDCLPYCSVFHTRSCYKGFSYVFLTQAISGLHYHHSS